MSKHKILSLCIFFLLLLASMQSCKSKESVLIQNTACQFPCWQKIQPGKSSGEETIHILSQLTFIDSPPSVVPQNITNTFTYTSWNFQKNIREEGGWIAFFNDKVTYILFDENNHVRVADMIGYYGKPEFVSVMTGQNDTQWLQIGWLYPSQGVLIFYFDPYWRKTDAEVNITSSLSVDEIYYFDPIQYDNLLQIMFRTPADLSLIKQSIQIWNDYGIYPFTEIK